LPKSVKTVRRLAGRESNGSAKAVLKDFSRGPGGVSKKKAVLSGLFLKRSSRFPTRVGDDA
jgi:hypothetical protein